MHGVDWSRKLDSTSVGERCVSFGQGFMEEESLFTDTYWYRAKGVLRRLLCIETPATSRLLGLQMSLANSARFG